MTDTPTPTNSTHRWIRIGGLLAVPVLIGAMLFGYAASKQPEALADETTTETTIDIPAETTTTTTPQPVSEEELETIDGSGDEDPVDTEPPVVQEEPANDEEAPDEEPLEDEEADPPVPALFHAPSEVNVSPGGNVNITLANHGEETLDIVGVSTNGFPLEVTSVPPHVDGYSDETLTLKVNTGGMAPGPYSMTVTVTTDVGLEDIEVKGTVFGLVMPTVADLDFATNYVVGHNDNLLWVIITNNEDTDVDIDISSSPRLTMVSELTLSPGINLLAVTVLPAAVPWNEFQILQLTLNWDTTSESITIMKWGF